MTTQRNVLILAYYFPPMGLSGVQRTAKFVKYLPQFGWQPTVLTVTPTGYYAQDTSLLDEVTASGAIIERVGSLDPNRLFRSKGIVKMPSERWRKILSYCSDALFIPDNKIGWRRPAVKAASELFTKTPFDVIFATAPPFTGLLAGMDLSKKFHKPLVVDYRDPWLDYPYKHYPTPLHRWRNYSLEKKALHAASRIITTNRRVKELILKHYKFLDYNDITILPQGYDPADFSGIDGKARPSQRMRFTHAGLFYGERTPKYFLEGLKKAFESHPDLRNRIEVCFVGALTEEQQRLIGSFGLNDNIVMTGYLDHPECVRTLAASDVLWLMLGNDVQSPGKVYEYLGAQKPVIACVPEGFVRQTLREAGGSIIVEPDDVDGVSAAILRLHDQYVQKTLPAPRAEIVKKYDRVELAKELSFIFGFLAE
jgi:glycosyltransferase involved in cell wall biosynthesis